MPTLHLLPTMMCSTIEMLVDCDEATRVQRMMLHTIVHTIRLYHILQYPSLGSDPSIKEYLNLNQRQQKIIRGFEKTSTSDLLDPGRWPHPWIPIPCRQMLWILTLVCFQTMRDYWLRHVPPGQTMEFATRDRLSSQVSALYVTA